MVSGNPALGSWLVRTTAITVPDFLLKIDELSTRTGRLPDCSLPMTGSGRQGKQPDGSALTREVKLVTVWSAELTDQEGIPVRDKGSVSYSAAIESAAERDTDTTPSEFALRV